MPSKLKNAKPMDGVSWEDRFAITDATGKGDLRVVFGLQADEAFVIAVYDGAASIDLTDYAGFPLGTIIIDTEVFSLHMKIAAEGTSTWKSSTVWS